MLCHQDVWHGLFDSFGKDSISNVEYVRNYDDVIELDNETDSDSRSILIDTRPTVMITVTAWIGRKSSVLWCQCNIVPFILLAVFYSYFPKNI